jgi:AAA+ ATPase superfamily predicted ATPase
MKPKKEITEQDLELLERHINSTKLQLIDIRNQFNKSLGRIKGTLLLYFLILAIGLIIGYII